MAKGSRDLVIVESPAKARTINKFLGKGFRVEASMGHFKDLPKSKLGVDVENNFEPTYRVIPARRKALKKLQEEAKQAAAIWIATDPDREGEAIGFHLAEELGGSKEVHRVLLTEITKRGVKAAFEQPTEIDQHKVDAQQARRILDRIVGYTLSPLLWEKVRRGLSAGRVQSVALRMIVERQREIDAFVSEEYWRVDARLKADTPPEFLARLIKIGGKKAEVRNKEEADRVQEALRKAAFRVASVEKKQRRRNPPPPFITSRLQQEAARRLRFPVRRTMSVAQGLYEGKDLGPLGTVGLITYMRTDSTRVSDQALSEVREHIQERFGAEYVPKKPRKFKAPKGAQEAHEAIRPTSLDLPPEKVRPHLEREEFSLYSLIWSRFVASQMATALYDDTVIDVEADDHLLRAKGSVLRFPGWLALDSKIDKDDAAEARGKEADEELGPEELPALEGGETLKLEELLPEQHFTQPPPSYTEASLVRALEENGIGRPSTYASITQVIQKRDYVRREKGKFHPTELGLVVSDLLIKSFGDLINVGYTARMEEELDQVEAGELEWRAALQEFHGKFQKDLERAQVEMEDVKRKEEPTDEKCEKCSSPMVIKWGRYGRFMACSGYPDCKNTRQIAGADGDDLPDVEEDCPKCAKPMKPRRGRYGLFLACQEYPECKGTRKIVTTASGEVKIARDRVLDEKCPECGSALKERSGRFGPFVSCSTYPECRYVKRDETGVACPREGCAGQIVQKRSRRGRIFYGCDKYPDCDFVVWARPVAEKCPDCGAPFLVRGSTKKEGPILRCNDKECKYRRPAPELES